MNQIKEDIYAAYVASEKLEEKRTHLGASLLGNKCMRSIYYEFRWYDGGFEDGRILRLFDTGKREEDRVLEDLRNIGFEIQTHSTATGKQLAVRDSTNHFGGSIDGLIVRFPEKYGLAEKPHILEVKTHSDKNFAKLRDKGMRVAFPKHYAQVQVYMGMSNCHQTLYVGVNKNTDDMHFEVVSFDQAEYDATCSKAEEVLLAPAPLLKTSNTPAWFECKMCKFSDICHAGKKPQINCRTCKNSIPIADGKWLCKLHDIELDNAKQLTACEQYDKNT